MAKLKAPTESNNIADIICMILDKGIVVDLWVKLLLVGTEILRLEARVVVASVQTYLAYAEAIGQTALIAGPPAAAIEAPAAVATLAAPGLDITVPGSRDIAAHAIR